MSWAQTITPDPAIDCRPGWCLEYVRRTFGLPAVHPTATAAWEASTTQHQDRAYPADVAVPVWYGLDREPAGHVVLRMPDGSCYSTSDNSTTPHHHPSLAELEDYYAGWGWPLTYRGWTEDVCGSPVIAWAGITAQGTTAPPTQEDENMSGFIDAGQANDIVEQTVERILERIIPVLDGQLRIHPIQAESIVKATVGRTVAQVKNDAIPARQADDIARAAARYTTEEAAK